MITTIVYIFVSYVIFDQQLKITFRKSSGSHPLKKSTLPFLLTLPCKNSKSASPPLLPTLKIFQTPPCQKGGRTLCRSFWFEPSLISELLKKSGGYVVVFLFLEKIFFCACLVRSALNDIFRWYGQSIIFNKSLLSVEAEVFIQFTMLNKEVSSAKSLTSEFSPSGRSFI